VCVCSQSYRRTSISGTTFSGKKCLSGTSVHAIWLDFPCYLTTLKREKVSKRQGYLCFFSRLSKFSCTEAWAYRLDMGTQADFQCDPKFRNQIYINLKPYADEFLCPQLNGREMPRGAYSIPILSSLWTLRAGEGEVRHGQSRSGLAAMKGGEIRRPSPSARTAFR
jgi:hypothetical protein